MAGISIFRIGGAQTKYGFDSSRREPHGPFLLDFQASNICKTGKTHFLLDGAIE
jgi:hypothetical protein